MRAELAHGEPFDDSLLGVVEPGGVGIQDRSGGDYVNGVRGLNPPGQIEHGVEPITDPTLLGVLLTEALKAVQLFVDRCANRVWHERGADPVAVVGHGVVAVGSLPQFLANRRQLLAEKELALLAFHTFAHALGNLLLDLVFGDGFAQPVGDQLETVGHVDGFEYLDPPLVRQLRPVCDGVNELARVVDRPEVNGHSGVLRALHHGVHQGAVFAHCFAHGGWRGRLVDRDGLQPQNFGLGRGARRGDW